MLLEGFLKTLKINYDSDRAPASNFVNLDFFADLDYLDLFLVNESTCNMSV